MERVKGKREQEERRLAMIIDQQHIIEQRILEEREQARKEKEKRQLKIDFYNFMNSPEVEIDKGWWPLVDPVFARIQALNSNGENIQIIRIKEKYGELRISVDKHNEEIDKLINEAWDKSTSICEHCGKPAEPVFCGWWIYTLCPDCLRERGLIVSITAKEYREQMERLREGSKE